MAIPRPHRSSEKHSGWEQFRSGLNYCLRKKEILAVTLLAGAEFLFGLSMTSMMPIYARDIFSAGALGLSNLIGSLGLGALIGAVFFLKASRRRQKGRLVMNSLYCLYGIVFLFSISRSYRLSLMALIIAGFFMVTANATMTDLVQRLSPPNYRARIMSVYITASLGLFPIGSLLVGLLAEFLGVQWSVASFTILAAASTWIVADCLPQFVTWEETEANNEA
jgi:predicted MFS family arabinose efflux permease